MIEVLGVINVTDKSSREPFGPDDLKVISAVAAQASMAIKNAQLYSSLSSEKEKLATIVTEITDRILITDADWRVLAANPAAQHLLGLEAANREELNLLDHLSEFQFSVEREDLVKGKEKSMFFEFFRLGTASPLTVSTKMTRICNSCGNLMNIALTLRDVTEDRMEELVRGELLSLLSHKFRTPPIEALRRIHPQEKVEISMDIAPDLPQVVAGREHVLFHRAGSSFFFKYWVREQRSLVDTSWSPGWGRGFASRACASGGLEWLGRIQRGSERGDRNEPVLLLFLWLLGLLWPW